MLGTTTGHPADSIHLRNRCNARGIRAGPAEPNVDSESPVPLQGVPAPPRLCFFWRGDPLQGLRTFSSIARDTKFCDSFSLWEHRTSVRCSVSISACWRVRPTFSRFLTCTQDDDQQSSCCRIPIANSYSACCCSLRPYIRRELSLSKVKVNRQFPQWHYCAQMHSAPTLCLGHKSAALPSSKRISQAAC